MVSAVVLCALALGAVGVSLLWGTDAAVAQGLAERAESDLDGLAAQLTPGKLLYMKIESYNRHGPRASVIEGRAWAPPERSVHEVWLRVDGAGELSIYRSSITDADGRVVQRTSSVDGELRSVHVGTGAEMSVPNHSAGVAEYLRATARAVLTLDEEGFRKVGADIWDGEETVIFEMTQAWVNPFPDGLPGEDDIVLPWTLDLEPEEIVRRTEAKVANPLFFSEQIWAGNKHGQRTLVRDDRVVALEVRSE